MKSNLLKLVVVTCALFGSVCVFGKSVYVISVHGSSTVKAFEIDEDELTEQDSKQIPHNGSGAIDLAVSEDDDVLFASYDGVNVIEVVDARTMEPLHTETISGSTENEIAGLTYCHTYHWLLCAERYDTDLRVLTYDPFEHNFSHSTTVTVPGVEAGLFGICFDETEMRIYISQSNTVVKCYELGKDAFGEPTLTYIKDIPIRWNDQNKMAVGVAVYNDGQGAKYLYSVGYNHEVPSQEHPYLIRTDIEDPNSTNGRLGTYMGSNTYAVGIDVDKDTGYVYLTTLGDESSIRVYDPSIWTSDPNENLALNTYTDGISGPAGLAVGSQFKDDELYVCKGQVSPDPEICVEPGDLVTYEIGVHPGEEDQYNVIVRDKLPLACDFVWADPNDGTYDVQSHIYTWDVGFMAGIDPNAPGDPNTYYQITVRVNVAAEPGGTLINIAEAESDTAFGDGRAETCVDCWSYPGSDPNVIYVDGTRIFERIYLPSPVDMAFMENLNTGTSWDDAYSDLNDALERAKNGCGNEIWVAQGVYAPDQTPEYGFVLPEGVSVYGGFNGTETARSQRRPKKYETILTGLIEEQTLATSVVTMQDETLLDGFTITKSSQDGQGIFASGADFSVANSKIDQNFGYGAYIEDGDATFTWCYVTDNKRDGIRHSGAGYTLTLENCWVQRSQRHGIFCTNSTPTIRNSIITESDMANEGRAGLLLENSASQPVLQNVTCAHNKTFGVWRVGGTLPTLKNCIVYHNGGPALAGFSAEQAAQYSCIQDCNEVNSNINDDPEFVYFDPINVRITSDSPCHDTGLTLQENYAQVDMDNRTRILGTAVDRGAYEIECEDTSNSFDTNHDGLVNFYEFSAYSQAWLSRDPNDPSIITDPNFASNPDYADPNTLTRWRQTWNPKCDLITTGDSAYRIDLADLLDFLYKYNDIDNSYWLWRACWLTDDDLFEMSAMSGGGEGMMMEMLEMEPLFADPVEENPYTAMPMPELVSLVIGIDAVLDAADIAIAEGGENVEDWLEIKDFLESVLEDIKASRQ